ncbi:16857_t:CDS:2, partial [Racocetra persica]
CLSFETIPLTLLDTLQTFDMLGLTFLLLGPLLYTLVHNLELGPTLVLLSEPDPN